ncbi:uncharacterized protein LOC111019278 isoform X2 [Momordica charantia]|uniref:Uncharacterized protein LOC111019278 isoform X2 n=1 Tax=Momordica charantia TaxID=3673 RepID=A0A6J1DD47_MOMCH|nr:uncharacterized protein LOC111019278 isoform X2 [Momordica charantia]
MIATGTACKRILELKCIFVILESRTWEIIYMDSHLLRLFPIYWEGKMKIYDHNASDTLQGQNFSSFTMLQPHSMPRLSKRK